MDKFDAVIIGGGIGGLTSACLLARKGAKVALFEKEKQAGGYCSSFSVDGYTFDACTDSIGGLNKNEPLRQLFEEDLRIWDKLDLYELNPGRRNIFPGMVIDVPAGISEYKDVLKSKFPLEGQGIDKAFSLMEQVYVSSVEAMRGSAGGDLLFDFIDKSFNDVLTSFISDKKLHAVLSSYCTFLGLPANEVSAIAASNLLIHYTKGGIFRVRGGIQRLSNTLVDDLRKSGGEVYLNEKATRILCNDGCSSGIVTESGRQVSAKHVISNMDLKTAIKLISNSTEEEGWVQRIEALKVSGSFVLVYLGVKDDLRRFDLASSSGYFSSFDFDSMLNRNEHISFGLSIASLSDPTVAPEGCSNVVIHYPFCYNEPLATKFKQQISDRLIKELDKHIPGISKSIAYQSVASPDTLKRYTGNTLGAAYGWEQGKDFFKNLPLFRNLLENFHIVGHWAGYGGGVMPSMLSGYKAAKDIMKQEGWNGR